MGQISVVPGVDQELDLLALHKSKLSGFLEGQEVSTKSWFPRKFGWEGIAKSREIDYLFSCRSVDKREQKNVPELESTYFPNWPCILEGPGRVVPILLKTF